MMTALKRDQFRGSFQMVGSASMLRVLSGASRRRSSSVRFGYFDDVASAMRGMIWSIEANSQASLRDASFERDVPGAERAWLFSEVAARPWYLVARARAYSPSKV